MKLHQVWAKRLAIMTLVTTIGISGGVLGNPQHASAAESAVSTSAVSKASKIISLGLKYKGTPYKFGAKVGQTRTFDCSTLTKFIYGKYGINLPRTSAQQSKMGSYVSKRNWKKGDLLFFSVPGRSGVGHVGVYVGNNKMLHTYGAGGVKISTVNSYWNSHYITARRVI
ncbi:C40 family peptidase [Paenibacillus agricola]|uniref:C40 family peptidase n=1 Tax=Paenibacillus agricola TaxID=2716264 RepID=A0ABX0JCV6_9BACL|nr:C40 family peptidase [Paenibacillus agricola]NHN33393.1 C40 family peptidase [Paenibacillus agricola]